MQAITLGRILTPLVAVLLLLPISAKAATVIASDGSVSGLSGQFGTSAEIETGSMYKGTFPDTSILCDQSVAPESSFHSGSVLILSDTSLSGLTLDDIFGLLSPPCTSDGDYFVLFTGVTDSFYVYFTKTGSIYAGGQTGSPINHTTHIDFVLPINNSTTSTGVAVPLEALGWVNVDDFNKHPTKTRIGWTLTASTLAASQCADVSCAAAVNFPTYYEYISPDGPFDISTTTAVLNNGIYTLRTAIQQPASLLSGRGILGLFGFTSGYTDLVATTTRFIVGSSTTLDQIIDNALGYGAQLNSSTTAAALGSCSPISGNFDIGLCASVLFMPSASNLQSVFDTAKDGILQRAPWGYISRVVAIVGDTSTTTAESLPSFTVHVNTSSTSSTTLAFDPGDMLSGGAALLSSIKDPRSGLDLEEIVGPWVQLFIALSVIIIIFHDVMAMGHATKGRA